MRFDFTCFQERTVSVSLLKGGIFHLRITPAGREKQLSALDKYGYLENVPEENPVAFENNADYLTIESSKGSLLFDKKQAFFELTDADGKSLFKQTALTFSGKCASAAFAISSDVIPINLGNSA